jgi:hypothetical protein
MIKILMEMKGNEKPKYFNACQVLADLNNSGSLTELILMKWNENGKKDFLMGKTKALNYIIVKPLTEEQAEQAINEYKKLGYN